MTGVQTCALPILGGKVVNYAALRSSYFAGSSANWNLNSNFALANRWTMIDPVTGISMKETSFINGFADINDYYAYIDNVNAGKTFYNPSTATNIPLTDQYVEDASFLRINTVSLGYTLPKKFTQKLHLNNVRVFATGYNLFVFTKYSGVDPEVDCATSTPLTPGVDYASYPKSRSFVGGINVTF